ncbi:TonB family protein [Caulobacter sp. RL271]|jgi:TonB family protein|uniref:TonB family protein n=1 Tax=Caulobacter segnis TaxID=88688 RepID=A0ABY4ZQ93_9CAUL|nr:TonB family protein [Caulobacter segnis]USQ94893.1 TonB family protein [Caulobacter segnis]
MRGLLCLARTAVVSLVMVPALLAPTLARAAIPPPPSDPKAPIRLVSFAAPPVSVTCAGGPVALLEGAGPPPKLWQVWMPPVGQASAPPYTPPPPPTAEVYGFSIDAGGHPADLKRKTVSNGLGIWNSEEHAAILASWRFPAGAAAKDCSVDLAPSYIPLAEASPARLFEALAADPRNAPPMLRKAVAADGDCVGAERRRPKTMSYPDTRPFDDKTVDPAWAGLTFDIDAGGATRNVRVVAQHGAPAFTKAVTSAVAKGRYFPGPARTRCYIVFKAMPKATDAPKREGPPAVDEETCKITREQLNLPENKFFPPAYARQRVGGRALLRFDVAPWGQIGAVEVLESQPTAAFGDAARMLLGIARPKAAGVGHHGCVVPIIYAIPPSGEQEP